MTREPAEASRGAGQDGAGWGEQAKRAGDDVGTSENVAIGHLSAFTGDNGDAALICLGDVVAFGLLMSMG